MSKVLIDRAVLEATLEHAEFVSGAACEADDAIRSALSAPSGTPVMPVKAYYHEAPNEHGGFNKSVGLEQRKTFSDVPLVLESDALMQIACLEGEIAKRDARIVELEGLLRAESARVDFLDAYIVTADAPDTGKVAMLADSGTLRECIDAALSAGKEGE